MADIALFDIDGTLVNCDKPGGWTKEEYTWANFIGWVEYQPVVKLAKHAYDIHKLCGREVIIMSARPEKYRKETEKLLLNLGIVYNDLILRSDVLVGFETQMIAAATSSEEVTEILHRNHSDWRRSVLEGMDDVDKIQYAYDDQPDNLKIIQEETDASCWLVTKSGILLPYNKMMENRNG